jgi:hypothetical protein
VQGAVGERVGFQRTAPVETGGETYMTAAISWFARLYADQNECDHAQLVGAIAAGAVESQPG